MTVEQDRDKRKFKPERRRVLRYMAGASAICLGSIGRVAHADLLTRILNFEATVNQAVQHAVVPSDARAQRYPKADISKHFKSNGTHNPANPQYQKLVAGHFVDWRLKVDGLVNHSLNLSLAELRAMPSVTQITRHDCVEGWSCIGEWTGVPLDYVLALAGVKKHARYVMFFCYDKRSSLAGLPGTTEQYYESIDLDEAHHPDTLLAYGMNGQTLPIPYGAPLRLRLGRQLGYKMPKYLRRITLVEDFRHIEGGHGGFYEDYGYAWYAGI